MRPKERLLRRGKIPNEEKAIRSALEAWSDRLSHWTEGFTALVVLGLVIEYLPEITHFLSLAEATEIQVHTEVLRQIGRRRARPRTCNHCRRRGSSTASLHRPQLVEHHSRLSRGPCGCPVPIRGPAAR